MPEMSTLEFTSVFTHYSRSSWRHWRLKGLQHSDKVASSQGKLWIHRHDSERTRTASLRSKKQPPPGAGEENIKDVNIRGEKGQTKWVRNGRRVDYGWMAERWVKEELQLLGSSHLWNRVIHDGAHEASRHPGWEKNNSQSVLAKTATKKPLKWLKQLKNIETANTGLHTDKLE